MLQVFSETSEINVLVHFYYFVYSENHQAFLSVCTPSLYFRICRPVYQIVPVVSSYPV